MQTFTVQITNDSGLKALHALEEKRFIRIVENDNFDSFSLQGKSVSIKAFKDWIGTAERTPVMDLKEVKAKWAAKRKELQKLTK